MEQTEFNLKFLEKDYPSFYITDLETAVSVIKSLEGYDNGHLFGIDTETCALPHYKYVKNAALSPNLSTIRLLQLFDGTSSFVFDLMLIGFDEGFHKILKKFLNSKEFVAHNALFDLMFFKRMGFGDIKLKCTLLLWKLISHAVYPHDGGLGAGLDDLTEKLLKTPILKIMGKSDWSEPDLTFEQVEYAALDPICCMLIYEKLIPALHKYKMERIYKLVNECHYPIASMQLNGVGIDEELHRKHLAKWKEQLYAARDEVLKITGLQSLSEHKIADWLEVELPKGVLEIWPRTENEKNPKLSTASETLAQFDYLPVVKPLSEYKKLDKLVSSFGEKMLSQINPATKRLHPSFKLCGARTGRMSCSNPNLQQAVRSEEFRSVFIPEKGNVLVVADFSQIESRVGAELSRDRVMLKAFKDGVDLHRLTAASVTGKSIENVTKEDRQKAKAYNFGLMFGLGVNKFSSYAKKSYGLDISHGEAYDSIMAWRELYGGYHAWQLRQAEKAAQSFVCTTPCGKVRKLLKDNTFGTSMNQGVQGGAAEIMMYSLTILYDYINSFELQDVIKIISVVHDEIILECKKAFAEIAMNLLEGSMTQGYLAVFPNGIINGLVEASYGSNWADAKSGKKSAPIVESLYPLHPS